MREIKMDYETYRGDLVRARCEGYAEAQERTWTFIINILTNEPDIYECSNRVSDQEKAALIDRLADAVEGRGDFKKEKTNV